MEEYKFPDEQKDKNSDLKLELELDPNVEPEIEIVDDTPPKDQGRKPLDKEVDEPTDDEMNEYSSKVQKRMKELTHARHDERRRADAIEREKQEFERAAKLLAEENRRLQEYVQVGQTAYIDKSKSLAHINLESAKAKLRAAYDAGDSEAMASAQQDMVAAQLQMQEVNNFRPTPLRESTQPVYTQPQAPQKPQAAPDKKLESWATRNPWFERAGDEDLTGYAYGVHNQLVREYGNDYTRTDEYYHKIENAVKKAFPDRFEEGSGESESTRRSKPVVAAATRTTTPKKIRLSLSQQNVAKKLGIPLELYAKKLVELENQNG
jgi:hypothetical protein